MPDPNNSWKTVNSRIIHRSRYLTIHEDDIIAPNGKPDKYTYVDSPPFVLIVGFDNEHFIMVRQYRYPLKRMMVEFPGGSINEGETPQETAKREFEEETGLTASDWTQLGIIHNPNLATVYLAKNFVESEHKKPNDDGIAEVLRLTREDINLMITKNELTDSKTLAGILLFEQYIQDTRH